MDSLPIIGASAMPAEVRNGTAEDKKTYRAALSFERELLTQLTKQLAETTKGEDESAATSAYRDMLPGSLADSMVQAGGTGIARSLYASLKEQDR
jgi:Rod binding domain-containing protein